MLEGREDVTILDVRSIGEYARSHIPDAVLIPLATLRDRMKELPRDKAVLVYTSVGLRAYEAALILRAAGFEKVRVLDGGLALWPFALSR